MADIDILNQIASAIYNTYTTIQDTRTFLDYQQKFLISDSAYHAELVNKAYVGIGNQISDGVATTVRAVNGIKEIIALNTNMQSERIVQTVEASRNSLSSQMSESTNRVLASVDGLTTKINDLDKSISTRLDKLFEDLVSKEQALLDDLHRQIQDMVDSLTKKVEDLFKGVASAVDNLSVATLRGDERIATSMLELGQYLASSELENTRLTLSVMSDIGKTMHADSVDNTNRVSGAINGISATIVAGIAAAALGIDAAIAASATVEATPLIGAAASLATIASMATKIAGAIELLFGADLLGLTQDPEKWIGDIVVMISEMYYKVGQGAYESFPSADSPPKAKEEVDAISH